MKSLPTVCLLFATAGLVAAQQFTISTVAGIPQLPGLYPTVNPTPAVPAVSYTAPAIGPTTGTLALQLISPSAFFYYVIVLTIGFTLFATWRLRRRKEDRIVEEREVFLQYPQTSPEIYAWLPYHKEAAGAAGSVDSASSPSPPRTPDGAAAPVRNEDNA